MDGTGKSGAGVKKVFESAGGDKVVKRGGDAVKQLAQAPADSDLSPEQLECDAVLEAAFLAAAADGEITEDEVGQLAASLESIIETTATDEEIENLLDTYQSRIESDGIEARVAAIAEVLRGRESAGAAYVLASGIAALDGGTTDDEGAFLGELGAALGLSDEEMDAYDQQVDAQMNPA